MEDVKTTTNNLENNRPKILIVGVGGAGCNAINDMIKAKLDNCDFLSVNTDAQSLHTSETANKIQIGDNLTHGLGAGSDPVIGKESAQESIDMIKDYLKGMDMVFITAGMGGGTGTGAAPVIAQACKEMGILTVGFITKPFAFEGSFRDNSATNGIIELKKHLDTLIIIPNENLLKISDAGTSIKEAFKNANLVLYNGVRSIIDLMLTPGLINLDFSDIKTILKQQGIAIMGTGESSGEQRAISAAEQAINNPLLENTDIFGATGVLVSISGDSNISIFEIEDAIRRIRNEINNEDTNIIFGCAFNDDLEDKIRVSIIATGLDSSYHTTSSEEDSKDKKSTNDKQKIIIKEVNEDKKDLGLFEKNKDNKQKIITRAKDNHIEFSLDDIIAQVDDDTKNKVHSEKKTGFFHRMFTGYSTEKTDSKDIKNTETIDKETPKKTIDETQSTKENVTYNEENTEDLTIPSFLRKK